MKGWVSRSLGLVLCLLVPAVEAAAQVTILSQDFESGTPWTRTQNTPSVGWEFGTSLGSEFFPIPAHTRYAASNDDEHDDVTTTKNRADRDRIITPVMNLTPYSGVVVDFDYVQPGEYGSIGQVEVTTNGGGSFTPVATVATSSTWTRATVNLSDYTFSNSVQVAFRHDDGGAWADGFAIDDVVVRSIPPRDASLDAILTPGIAEAGIVPLEFRVTNGGSDTITALTVSYTIDGGGSTASTITGLSIATGDGADLFHPIPPNLVEARSYDIELSVEAVNGGPDQVAGNDTAATTISVVSELPEKRVLLEIYTGSWCGFCPDATVIKDDILASNRRVIAVNIHEADVMEIPDGSTLAGTYIGGYPGGLIDRVRFDGESEVEVPRNQWTTRVDERSAELAPVAVRIDQPSYDAGTREIEVTVHADFAADVDGDLRVNAWIVEDGVTGDSDYDQTNYYNGQGGHPYFGAGDPIVGFVHDHTVRAMLGGPWGTAGVIPASVFAGGSYAKTYTTTLPAGVDPEQVWILGVVSRYDASPDARPVLNADRTWLLPLFTDDFESGNVSAWDSSVGAR